MGRKYGLSFSLSRLLGIQKIKQGFAKITGVPTTTGGLERKIGRELIKFITRFIK